MTGRMEGRLALITGASRGLGAAVAKRYAREGAHVILVARTIGGLEEVDDAIKAEGGLATLVPADLTDGDGIDQIGGAIAQRFGRLDVLVGNAAILGVLSPAAHVDPAVWGNTVALNLTANYRLIRSFDPLLRESKSGRAIFVTSTIAQGKHPYWAPYAATKAGLEALVRTYAGEVEKTDIRVNLFDPGIVRTALRAEAYPGEDPKIHPLPDTRTDAFVDLAEPSCTTHGAIIQAA
jgi:NAD(P)-dependent dehydrogenase (short-subunit alcohol dehydrogenase family)